MMDAFMEATSTLPETPKHLSPLRKLLPFWLFMFFFKFGASIHYTALPPLGERIMPVWLVGLLVGVAAFVQLLLDVPAGFLMDRKGYIRFLRYGTAIFIVGTAAFFFGLSIVTFVATLALGMVGWLFFGPGTNAYVLVRSTKEEAGRYMALRDTFGSIGVVLAMLVFAWLVHRSIVVLGATLFAILAAGYIALIFTPEEQHSIQETEQKLPTQHHYIRRHYFHHIIGALGQLNPASTMLMLQRLSASIFYGTIWFVVPIIVADSIGGSEILGAGLGVFDLAIVVLGWTLGKLADRSNKKRLVFFGLLVFALAATLIGFHFSAWFLLFGFLATAGDEMSSVSLWAWLDVMDEKHTEDALVSGAVNTFEDLGYTIGPILAGVLFGLIGPSWTVAVGGCFILVTWAVSMIFVSRYGRGRHIPRARYKKPHHFRHKH
jgi:MFS family permease